MVKQLATKAEWDEALANNAKVAVDFTATWCGPCQFIGPKFEQLAGETDGVLFVKVDVDENAEVAQELGIEAMPTFRAYAGGKQVGETVGADEAALRDMVAKLVSN